MASVPAQGVKTDYSDITRNNFPPDFVFGTGTAAYQHEGGAAVDGRGISVWDVFTMNTPSSITDGNNGNVAIDMYKKYEEDIRMMKSMGFDAYRFSISWSRVLPGGRICLGVNKDGIKYYNDVINTLLAHGIVPYVTLFHWDLPYTLEQEYAGFLSEDIVNDFREFADLCFWEFGDRVKHWFTFNEAWTYCYRGYVDRNFPPAKVAKSRRGYYGDSSPHNLADITKNLLSLSSSPSLATQEKIVDISNRALNSTKKLFDDYRCHNFNIPTIADNQTMINFNIPTIADNQTMINFNLPTFPDKISDVKDRISAVKDKSRGPFMSEDEKEVFIAGKYMLLAHAAAVELYRTKFQKNQKGKIGITLNTHWFEPKDDNEEDKAAARRVHDFKLGWFLEPVLHGQYPETMEPYIPREARFSQEESNMLKENKIDFLGLNYYTARYVKNKSRPDPSLHPFVQYQYADVSTEKNGIPIGEAPGASWINIVPWGIKSLLKKVNELYNNDTYNLPAVYITENGLADLNNYKLTAYEACVDTKRILYHQDHLGNIREAMDETNADGRKLQVNGYFAWSWADNFEWADGYTLRFGLIYVDYMNHLKRHPKHSAKWFSHFLVKNET